MVGTTVVLAEHTKDASGPEPMDVLVLGTPW
jgi:hypothetical protein